MSTATILLFNFHEVGHWYKSCLGWSGGIWFKWISVLARLFCCTWSFFLYLGQRSFAQIVHSNRDLLLSSMVDAKVWLFNFWLAEVPAPLTASEPGSWLLPLDHLSTCLLCQFDGGFRFSLISIASDSWCLPKQSTLLLPALPEPFFKDSILMDYEEKGFVSLCHISEQKVWLQTESLYKHLVMPSTSQWMFCIEGEQMLSLSVFIWNDACTVRQQRVYIVKLFCNSELVAPVW